MKFPVIALILTGVFSLTLIVVLVQAVAQAPDFNESYKTGPESADAGDTITYTIVAVNSGDAITGVHLTDPIPNGAAYAPGSCTYRRARRRRRLESGP